MNVTDFQEIWQVDVGDQVYEANFEVLTQWIFEGSLLPQDKVRRGNLRWIEARRVPSLVPFFNAKENGTVPPTVTTSAPAVPENPPATSAFDPSSGPVTSALEPTPSPVTVANPYQTTIVPTTSTADQASAGAGFPIPATSNPAPVPSFEVPAAAGTSQTAPEFASIRAELPGNCSMHPDSPAFFVCDACANVFCKLCPKSYGGTVRICPFCGAMCQRIEQMKAKSEQAANFDAALAEGFGFADFGRALGYPFKFKPSLVFGALMFSIFTIGQSASSVGGIFLFAASLMCYMLANTLYFGVLTNVLENFAQGFTDRNFMPSFDDFSLWDDVVHPFFLSIAVYLVSFGVFIAVVAGGAYYAVRTVQSDLQAKELEAVRNLPTGGDRESAKYNEFLEESPDPANNPSNRSVQSGPGDEEEEFRKLNEFIQEQRKKQLESGIGKTPETVEKERNAMIAGFFKLALPLLLLAGLSLLWGLFYWPAACLVAGYTRSFASTLNPKVGLETIRILGVDYFKILFIGLLIAIGSGIVGGILGVIFAAFDMPAVGNLPANAIGALFSFYFSVVFSLVLGYALYKNSAKLNLFRA